VDPEVLYGVPAGGTTNVTLKVIPPAEGVTLGSGCYIDVESYIDGKLISGIRKVDLPPVHTPLDEPSYAESELTISPDPPVVGQTAQICTDLTNYVDADQTVDVTLYAADFGMGLPFTEVGRMEDVVIPGKSTINRCLPWIPPPGSEYRCLQLRIELEGYDDIISQRNMNIVTLPGTADVPMTYDFAVGNPTDEDQTVQLDVRDIGLPAGWVAAVDPPTVTLGAGESFTGTLTVGPTGGQAQTLAISEETMPGDAHLVSVEAYIKDQLIGGLVVEYEVEENKVYLPIIMKKPS